MRDFKGIKRQRGRNRNGGGGGGGSGGGGGKPQQNVNRAFDSNGPDNVKIRGHAQHVFEKYQQLARDAFSSGDRVLAENYLQHADHYFRVLRTLQPQRPASEILGRDVFASGLDIDFEDDEGFEDGQEGGEAGDANGSESYRTDTRQEGGRQEGGRQEGGRQEGGRQEGGRQEGGRQEGRSEYGSRPADNRQDGNRQDGARQDGARQDGARQDGARQDGARQENGRADGGRQEGGRWEPRRDDRYESRPREDRFEPRRDGQRENQEGRSEPRRDDRTEFRRDGQQAPQRDDRPDGRRDGQDGRRDNRNRRDREPRELRFEPQGPEVQGGEPRRSETRGFAPRSEGDRAVDVVTAVEAAGVPLASAATGGEPSPVLRSEDGGVSEAPAFLQMATGGDEAADVRRPRAPRRRRPRSFEGADEGGDLLAAVPAGTNEEV